jgi:hypothetical protein
MTEVPDSPINDESFMDGDRLKISGLGSAGNTAPTLSQLNPGLEGQIMAEQQTSVNAHNFQDLTGKQYGKLIVLRRDPRDYKKKAFLVCACECGNECTVQAFYLTHGQKTDCGCRRGEKWKEAMMRFHQQHLQPTALAIAMTNGMAVIVDENDYSFVSQFWWSAHRGTRTTYARATSNDSRFLMHTLIMGNREGYTVDHVNGNGLDNRRCNLRFATPSEQSRNTHGGRGRSLYKGVTWAVRHRKWVASICADGKNRHIGYFDTEDEAARAYDAAALIEYGEFAFINFRPQTTGQENVP